MDQHIYKIQLTQEPNLTDHGQRGTYADWVYEHQEVDADFSMTIVFSNEAHFYLLGYANKQNCSIYGPI